MRSPSVPVARAPSIPVESGRLSRDSLGPLQRAYSLVIAGETQCPGSSSGLSQYPGIPAASAPSIPVESGGQSRDSKGPRDFLRERARFGPLDGSSRTGVGARAASQVKCVAAGFSSSFAEEVFAASVSTLPGVDGPSVPGKCGDGRQPKAGLCEPSETDPGPALGDKAV